MPAASIKPGEIDSLTTLRGLLALWVVVYHFWNDASRLFPALEFLSPLARAGHFAVPGFFILSGFVLAYNYGSRFTTLSWRGVIGFYGLRLARIYPVHLVTLLAVLVMVAVSDRLGYQLTDAGYSTRDFILNLFLMQTWVPDFQLNWNYPSWSISSEWFAYLIFPLATAAILSRVTTPARATVLAIVCVMAPAAIYVARPFPFRELVEVIPTFFAGTAIHAIIRNRSPASNPSGRWVPEFLVVALVAACYLPEPAGVVLVVLVLFGLILSLARLAQRMHRWWVSRGLLYVGTVSYSLYMTHTFAQKVLYRLLPSARFENSDLTTRLAIAAAYLLAIVAACLLSFYLVEEPCRKWFRRRLSARKAPAADVTADSLKR